MFPEAVTRGLATAVLAACVAACLVAAPTTATAQQQGAGSTKGTTPVPGSVFAEADAVRVLSEMRQALESNNRGRLLKLFDTRRMPGFAVFRNELTAFLETYDTVRMGYHVTQVTVDGEFGSVIADVTLEGAPSNQAANFRKSARVRLVCAWDGKSWKIADFSPRDLFR